MNNNRLDDYLGDNNDNNPSIDKLRDFIADKEDEKPNEEVIRKVLNISHQIHEGEGLSLNAQLKLYKHMKKNYDDTGHIDEPVFAGSICPDKGEGFLLMTIRKKKVNGAYKSEFSTTGSIGPENAMTAIRGLNGLIKHLKQKVKDEMDSDE